MTAEIGLIPIVHALLGSIRVLVMLITGPVFSHPALPMRIRVAAALMIAWAVNPGASGAVAALEWDVASMALAVATEVMIGLAVGVGAGLVFAGILQLGEFLAIQGGLAAAQAIDPASGTPSVAIGTALNTVAMMVFLSIGGHHELIRGVEVSFASLPIGGGMPDAGILMRIASLGSVIFEVAFRLAAPVTVVIFVQNVVTGVLGRAMPQLNLLLVNLPLHAGILFVMLGLGATALVAVLEDLVESWPSRIFSILLGGA